MKKKYTKEELNEKFGNKWDGVEVEDDSGSPHLIAVKKPSRSAIKAFTDMHEKGQTEMGVNVLLNDCVLTHSLDELAPLFEEHPTLDGVLATKAVELVQSGIVDAKKKPVR